MARGKHKVQATGRRTGHFEATLLQLRSELQMESEALAEAEVALAEVTRLQSELKAETAALVEEVAPYADALRQERDYLRSVFADIHGHHSRITEAWGRYGSAGIDAAPGATRLEQVEAWSSAMGLHMWLTDSNSARGRDLDVAQTTRIQRARGERRGASEVTAEKRQVNYLEAALDAGRWTSEMIRPSYRHHLIDHDVIFIDDDGLTRLRDSGTLDEQQNRIRTEALQTAQSIWESHASDIDASSVHVWGTGNVVSADGAPGPGRLALGFVSEGEGRTPLGPLSVAIGLPLPSTPVGSRKALALHSADDVLNSWRSVFATRRRLTEQIGLTSHPFAPLAHHPHPGQGLAAQNAYGLAAFSRWIHFDAGSAFAQTAVGLTSAATYWLPAGQTASFAESEPMDEADRAEMILPFPQVFLAFAEPLVLEPNQELSEEASARWRAISAMAHDAFRDNRSAGDVLEEFTRLENPEFWSPMAFDDLVAEFGAVVEGLLLLADPLGRPEDAFAWCLTIPGAYGATLGRFVVPALRSATAYRDVVDNLTAVVAWAQWHEPDQSTEVPLGVPVQDLEDLMASTDFQRNAKRAGAGIRVVNVGATHRNLSSHRHGEVDESEAHVTPHIRRGHWRRQRFGPGLEQVKRIRIAPVLVNAHRGDIAARVYRLRASTAASGSTPASKD